MRQHPLFFFFLMAYAFSWIVLIPFALSEWGIMSQFFSFTSALNPFLGPLLAVPVSMAAFIMTGITEGKPGVRRLLHRYVQWRAGWKWYLFILLGVPALLLLGIIVQPGALASFHGLPPPIFFLVYYLVSFIVLFLVGGLVGEEPGWRGFALPRMQLRYGPLWGTLLLGVLWGFWHLPHFLTQVQGGGPGTSFATFLTDFSVFFLWVMALAIIFTWVFNHTRGSVFIAILLHTSIDAPQTVWLPLFPAVDYASMILAGAISFGVAALLILILTRGRLGSQETGKTGTPR